MSDFYDSTKIKTFKHQENNKIYIQAEDLIWTLLEAMPIESCKRLIDYMLNFEEFNKALAEMITGHNVDELSDKTGDVLRKALIPYADKAAMQLIENLANEIIGLRDKLKEQKSFVSKLLSDWPDAFKKYIPKEVYIFSNKMYLDDNKYQRLLAFIKEEEKEGFI